MSKSLLFVLFGLAVMDCQPEPTLSPEAPRTVVVPNDSLITLKLIKSGNPALPVLSDSLLTVNLPKFDLIAAQSTTPDGKLERVDHVSANTTHSVNYLYNEHGQPAGYSSFAVKDAPERGRQVTYYEYKDNRPYRLFTKVYEPEIANDFVYFMDEFRYTDKRTITVWSYTLFLKKQQASLTTITVNTYDAKGHLVQSLEPGAGTVYQTFTWDKDNLISRQDFYADGSPLTTSTEYTYDDKPNPLQGLELRYKFELASANNILSETLTETDLRSKNKTKHQQDYEPVYDDKGRLSSKTSVAVGHQKGEKSLFIYK